MFEMEKKNLSLDTINSLVLKQTVWWKIKLFKKIIGYEIYEIFWLELKEWKEDFINQLEKVDKKFISIKLDWLSTFNKIQLDKKYQKLSQEIKVAFIVNNDRLLNTISKSNLNHYLFWVLVNMSTLSKNVAKIVRYLNNDLIKVIEIDAVLLERLLSDKQKLELLFSFIWRYWPNKIIIVDSLVWDKKTILTLLKYKKLYNLKRLYFKNL